jgi:hypothetical protein
LGSYLHPSSRSTFSTATEGASLGHTKRDDQLSCREP